MSSPAREAIVEVERETGNPSAGASVPASGTIEVIEVERETGNPYADWPAYTPAVEVIDVLNETGNPYAEGD